MRILEIYILQQLIRRGINKEYYKQAVLDLSLIFLLLKVGVQLSQFEAAAKEPELEDKS